MSPVRPRLALIVFAALLLTGCGAEVAATVGTVGALQAAQVKQAKDAQRQIETNLGDALKAAETRASTAQAQ